jgi:hypothetical protein
VASSGLSSHVPVCSRSFMTQRYDAVPDDAIGSGPDSACRRRVIRHSANRLRKPARFRRPAAGRLIDASARNVNAMRSAPAQQIMRIQTRETGSGSITSVLSSGRDMTASRGAMTDDNVIVAATP